MIGINPQSSGIVRRGDLEAEIITAVVFPMLLNIDVEYDKHYKSISKMASVLPLNKQVITAS